MIEFRAYGIPVPQGSKVQNRDRQGRVVAGMREANDVKLRPWRQEVAAAAKAQAELHGCLKGPLELHVEFRFPMPASRPKWVKDLGIFPKDTRPDADKCLRAIGDALEAGGLVSDDAQFVAGSWSKNEVWGDWTGALVRIDDVRVIRPTKGNLVVQPGLLNPIGDNGE